MDWIGWIRGPVGTALQWFEAHPGTASWLEAIGSIAAIVFVYLFALYQGRRTRSHENTDRIRSAQGLGACLNSRCSIPSESDSSLGHEQVFSPLEYRSDAASAAERAGF